MTTNTTTTTADAGQGVRRPYPVCPFACEREEAAQLGASSSDAPTPLGACSCPDDRCEGYHHEVGEPCGCGPLWSDSADDEQDAPASMLPALACPEWCTSTSHPFDQLTTGDGTMYHHATTLPAVVLSSGESVGLHLSAVSVIRETVPGVLVVDHQPAGVRFGDDLADVELTASDCDALAVVFAQAAVTLRATGGGR